MTGGAFEEQYDTDKYHSIWDVSRYIASVASGKRMASDISDYTFSFAGEAVIFEVVQDTIWKCLGPSDDNSLTIIYPVHGKKCVAKLWGEGKETTYTTTVNWEDRGDWVEIKDSTWIESGYWENEYDEWGNWIGEHWVDSGWWDYHYDYRYEYEDDPIEVEKTYTAIIPEKIIFTITEGEIEHVRMNTHVSLEKNTHAHFNLDCRVANLGWDFSAQVNSSSGAFAMNYTYGGKSLLTMAGAVPSYVVLGKNDNQTWEEWFEQYGDEYETLVHKLGGATAGIDLLGKIQVQAEVKSGASLYDALIAWDKKYDYDESITNWCNQPYNSQPANEELAALYNSNIDIKMYYNATNTVQAYIKSDVRMYTDEYGEYDPETGDYKPCDYYGIMPVLYFPADGTSYEFSNYFTESNFGNVIGWSESLANQYLELFVMMNFGEVDFD